MHSHCHCTKSISCVISEKSTLRKISQACSLYLSANLFQKVQSFADSQNVLDSSHRHCKHDSRKVKLLCPNFVKNSDKYYTLKLNYWFFLPSFPFSYPHSSSNISDTEVCEVSVQVAIVRSLLNYRIIGPRLHELGAALFCSASQVWSRRVKFCKLQRSRKTSAKSTVSQNRPSLLYCYIYQSMRRRTEAEVGLTMTSAVGR